MNANSTELRKIGHEAIKTALFETRTARVTQTRHDGIFFPVLWANYVCSENSELFQSVHYCKEKIDLQADMMDWAGQGNTPLPGSSLLMNACSED